MDTFTKFMDLIEKNKNSENDIGIIIYWPKSTIRFSSHDIGKELCHQYTGTLEVDMKFGTNLLKEIHYGKEWWDRNIEEETKKRFYSNEEILYNNMKNNITYVLYISQNLHKSFKGLKKTLREKYKVDKSAFHFSDPDCFQHLGINCNCEVSKEAFREETIKHIYLLTHPNTIHFLKNAVYKPNYKFNQYLNKYIKWLNIHRLTNNYKWIEFCIDNGGILGAYGIRDTHDVDFLYYPILYNNVGDLDDKKVIENVTNMIEVNDKDFGCENKNHRDEYLRLGYNIKDIIHNPENNFYHFGCKFMSLSILKKFKYNRTHTIGTGHKEIRQKDINDYKLITNIIH